MQRIAIALFVVLAAILPAACGTDRPLAAVHVGMTTAEVDRVVGRPDRDHVMAAACMSPSPEYWVYAGDTMHMTSFVYFLGDHVVEVVEDGHQLDGLNQEQLTALAPCGGGHPPT